MAKNKKFWKYFKAYKWSNISAMLKNNKKEPKICNDSAKGKLVVITGGTSGIGKVTVEKFASKGADIICINRNKEKSEDLVTSIKDKYEVDINFFIADLSLMEDTHKACEYLLNLDRPIDILIHNAGVYLTKKQYTKDGFEKVFMVNYLSSFIMNYRLIDKFKTQNSGRIILVNSEGHRFAAWGLKLDDLNWKKHRYSGLKSYGSAKLAQLQSMLIFEEIFSGTSVRINAMHPGAVKSETGQDNGKAYKSFKKKVLDKRLKQTEISAEAIYYLSISEEIKDVSGKFYNLTTLEEPTPPALDIEEARKLWQVSLDLAKLNEKQ
jgi:retinol dehydrogenase-13